jgi:hypothetical protein
MLLFSGLGTCMKGKLYLFKSFRILHALRFFIPCEHVQTDFCHFSIYLLPQSAGLIEEFRHYMRKIYHTSVLDLEIRLKSYLGQQANSVIEG